MIRIESIRQYGHRIPCLYRPPAGKTSGRPSPAVIASGKGETDMEVVQTVAAWVAFAVFHSVTISGGYERLARRAMGERAFAGFHRLLFTAYSTAALAAVLLFVRSLPDAPLYRVEGWARISFHAVQLAGAALLLWTPWDLQEFVGIRQLARHLRGETPPSGPGRLFTGMAYGIVRHPLYLGFSLILAFHPDQTRNSFASAATIVLYFYVGTFLEERRLERAFGEAYREYKRRVPRFLPLPRT
jgi:protein-S-isoprenylcysteine O-methyltransferase Ste14